MKEISEKFDELVACMQSELSKAYEPLPIDVFDTNVGVERSTMGVNGQFLNSQLLLDVLLRMPSSPEDRAELVSRCRQECQGTRLELRILREFEEDYVSTMAIWWYTREAFVYRVLNKALRTQDTDLLYHFRFIIRDLRDQLRSCACRSSVRVYRYQLMSPHELNILRNSVGQFISISSFLSTSEKREKALSFRKPSTDPLQSVLFDINAEPDGHHFKLFSKISAHSHFPDEVEILFMLGSIFRIRGIEQGDDDLWTIRLVLCSYEEQELKPVFDYMKQQFGDGETNLLSFGKILWTMGKFDDAERHFLRLLNTLSDDDRYVKHCHHALGNVASDKGDYESSLAWHTKAIHATRRSNDAFLAECYNGVGCAHDAQGDYERALEFYEKARRIWTAVLGEDHLNLASCWNNIACVHAERRDYSRALECYRTALNIRQRHLPRNHSDIGASHNNIGEVCRRQGHYDAALTHLNGALKIYRRSLPEQHPDIAEVLMNIGLVHERQHDPRLALTLYEQAAQIYHRTCPSTHPSVRRIDQLVKHLQSAVTTA